MPAELILSQAATDTALHDRRKQLAAARLRLAEREAELARLRAQLHAFESRYFRQVGTLYAELDDLEARIAEREVALYDSDAARARAAEARERAEQTRQAACSEEAATDPVDPPATLKALFREAVKRIHPDRAVDPAEEAYFTLLMARANHAYRRGDAEVLQRLLDDHLALDLTDDGADAQLQRVGRQLQQVQRDLATLDAEFDTLVTGDIGQLHRDAETAAREHRDLLAELATTVRTGIADAERRFDFIDRQIAAHGR